MSESATENKTAQQKGTVVQTKDQKEQKEHIEREYVERPKNTTKLQIKNLQFGTTKEDLHDLCRRFGQIVALEAKGTSGFVTYYKPDEAQLAIYTLDGYSYRGFILRVQFAREPLPQKSKDGESTVTNTTSTSASTSTSTSTSTTTTTTTTTATSATTKTDAKPTATPVVENKPRFAQQQQLAKPKQTTTFVQQPKEQPQNQNQQNPNQKGKKKGQQNQQNQQNKGKNQKPEPVKEVRTYRVSVEKTVINAGDQKEEGFTFPISHQQYLDYIIPLLKDIQTQKEKEKEKDKEQKERS
jgi:RNA recognition motif-containing protein